MDPETKLPTAALPIEAVDPAAKEPTMMKDEAPSTDTSAAIPLAVDASSKISQGDVPRFQPPLVFGQKEVAYSKPHHSQDLIGLYHVTPTAAKVARTHPETGEKINKLRSSYQNHIKVFQIAGRNKPVRHDNGLNGMSLREMAAWPEEEWRNQKVATKEVAKGLSSSALSRLERAVKLEPGPVPKNDEWENILGHEKIKPGGPASPGPDGDGKQSQPSKASKVNGQPNGAPAATEGEAIRARRTGKRRRYDDESFEGYGEGYVDDDRDDADGYSSGDGTKKRKRRKDLGAVGSPNMSGYGMGAQQQTIGRGIGAFGGR